MSAKIIQFPDRKQSQSIQNAETDHPKVLTPQIRRFISRVLIPAALVAGGVGIYNSYQNEPIETTVGCVGGDQGATELGKGNVLSERAQKLLESLRGDKTVTTVLGEAATEQLVNPQNILAVQNGMRNADGSVVENLNTPEAEHKFIDPAICVTNTAPRGNPQQIETSIKIVPADVRR